MLDVLSVGRFDDLYEMQLFTTILFDNIDTSKRNCKILKSGVP